MGLKKGYKSKKFSKMETTQAQAALALHDFTGPELRSMPVCFLDHVGPLAALGVELLLQTEGTVRRIVCCNHKGQKGVTVTASANTC